MGVAVRPRELADVPGMPWDADPVAVLCLGRIPEFPSRPTLELDQWAVADRPQNSSPKTSGREPEPAHTYVLI